MTVPTDSPFRLTGKQYIDRYLDPILAAESIQRSHLDVEYYPAESRILLKAREFATTGEPSTLINNKSLNYLRQNLNSLHPAPLLYNGEWPVKYRSVIRYLQETYGIVLEDGEFTLSAGGTSITPDLESESLPTPPLVDGCVTFTATNKSLRFATGSSFKLLVNATNGRTRLVSLYDTPIVADMNDLLTDSDEGSSTNTLFLSTGHECVRDLFRRNFGYVPEDTQVEFVYNDGGASMLVDVIARAQDRETQAAGKYEGQRYMNFTRADLSALIPTPLNIDGTTPLPYDLFVRFMLNSYGLLIEDGEFYLGSDPAMRPLRPGSTVNFVPNGSETDRLVVHASSRRFKPGSAITFRLIFPSALTVLGKAPSITEGQNLNYQYQLRGGFVPYNLLDTSGLPNGVTLSVDGWLRGTAPAGSYPFTARWRDNAGSIAYLEDTIQVQVAQVIVNVTISANPAAIVEGGSVEVRLNLNASAPSDLIVPIGYGGSTAVLGTDFTGPSEVLIPQGSTSASFTLTTVAANSQTGDSTIRVTAGSGSNHTVVAPGYVQVSVAKATASSGWYITASQKLYSADYDRFASVAGKGTVMPFSEILSNEFIELNYGQSYAGGAWRPLGENTWRNINLHAHGRCIIGKKIWSVAVNEAVTCYDTETNQTTVTTASRGNLLQGCKKLLVKYNASNNSWDTSQISIDEGVTWVTRGDFIGFPNAAQSATDGVVVMLGGVYNADLNIAMVDQSGVLYTRQLTAGFVGDRLISIVPLEAGWMLLLQSGKVFTSAANDPLNFTAATGYSSYPVPRSAHSDGQRVMLITQQGTVLTNNDFAKTGWVEVGSPVTNSALSNVMLRGEQYRRYNVVDDIIGSVSPTVWYRLNDVVGGGVVHDSSGNGYHGTYSPSAAVGESLSVSGMSLAPAGQTTQGGFTLPGTGFTLNANNPKGQFWSVFLKRDPRQTNSPSQYQHIVGLSDGAGLARGFQVSPADQEVQWNMQGSHVATANRPRTAMPDKDGHMYTIVYRPQGGRDRFSTYVDGKRVTTLNPNAPLTPQAITDNIYGGSPNDYGSSYGNCSFMSELMAGPGWDTDSEEASAIAKLYDVLKPQRP